MNAIKQNTYNSLENKQLEAKDIYNFALGYKWTSLENLTIDDIKYFNSQKGETNFLTSNIFKLGDQDLLLRKFIVYIATYLNTNHKDYILDYVSKINVNLDDNYIKYVLNDFDENLVKDFIKIIKYIKENRADFANNDNVFETENISEIFTNSTKKESFLQKISWASLKVIAITTALNLAQSLSPRAFAKTAPEENLTHKFSPNKTDILEEWNNDSEEILEQLYNTQKFSYVSKSSLQKLIKINPKNPMLLSKTWRKHAQHLMQKNSNSNIELWLALLKNNEIFVEWNQYVSHDAFKNQLNSKRVAKKLSKKLWITIEQYEYAIDSLSYEQILEVLTLNSYYYGSGNIRKNNSIRHMLFWLKLVLNTNIELPENYEAKKFTKKESVLWELFAEKPTEKIIKINSKNNIFPIAAEYVKQLRDQFWVEERVAIGAVSNWVAESWLEADITWDKNKFKNYKKQIIAEDKEGVYKKYYDLFSHSFGIIQWNRERLKALIDFAIEKWLDPKVVTTQLAFLAREIKMHGMNISPNSNAVEITKKICVDFVRPKHSWSESKKRANIASLLLAKLAE